jgi:GAF domain-containing protein
MAAFSQRVPAMVRNIRHEPQWGKLIQVLPGEGICAALSVPVELDGSPIGTLDIHSSAPWDWDDREMAAARTYAGVVASLLAAAETPRSRVGWPTSCRPPWSIDAD